MKKDLLMVSKTVSHALRHEPEAYGLHLDNQGWTSLAELINGLKIKGLVVTEDDIEEIIRGSEKKRFEIIDGKIRAFYGHSTTEKISKELACPPDFLYHGTAQNTIDQIKLEGLRPMSRQYVHLSVDEDTALITGKRKSRETAIIKVKAAEAYVNGIPFYKEENGVWLAEAIPSQYLIL